MQLFLYSAWNEKTPQRCFGGIKIFFPPIDHYSKYYSYIRRHIERSNFPTLHVEKQPLLCQELILCCPMS